MESAADPANPADTEIIVESDSEVEVDLRNIPEAAEDDTAMEEGNAPSGQRRRRHQVGPTEVEEPTGDEKKLGFSTHYESFNICGWVLCLLITRKGDKARSSAMNELKQPLMEEWISTQAQTAMDED